MDDETLQILTEMQEQIATLQQQITQLERMAKHNQSFVSIALRNLLMLCRWAWPMAKASGSKYTGEIEAAGIQIKACFPDYR